MRDILIYMTDETVQKVRMAATPPVLDTRSHLFAIPDDAGDLPGLLAERRVEDRATAYVCEGFQCRAPIRDVAELEAVLKAPEHG